eukprot:217657-Amphidinium_carterae.2
MTAAISCNGHALKYASAELKSDPTLVLVAANQNADALAHASHQATTQDIVCVLGTRQHYCYSWDCAYLACPRRDPDQNNLFLLSTSLRQGGVTPASTAYSVAQGYKPETCQPLAASVRKGRESEPMHALRMLLRVMMIQMNNRVVYYSTTCSDKCKPELQKPGVTIARHGEVSRQVILELATLSIRV